MGAEAQGAAGVGAPTHLVADDRRQRRPVTKRRHWKRFCSCDSETSRGPGRPSAFGNLADGRFGLVCDLDQDLPRGRFFLGRFWVGGFGWGRGPSGPGPWRSAPPTTRPTARPKASQACRDHNRAPPRRSTQQQKDRSSSPSSSSSSSSAASASLSLSASA